VITISNKGYLIIGLIVVVGAAGQWMGELTSQLWTLPAALLVAAMYAERAALPSMKYTLTRDVPHEVHLGEAFKGKVQVSNQGRRELSIEWQAATPDTFSGESRIKRFSVPAGETIAEDFNLTPLELGDAGLGDLYIRVLGFMGLVWWHRRDRDEVLVRVVPGSMSNSSRGAGESVTGIRRYSRKPMQGGMEFLAHREYQHGDPLQSVDWKASARSNNMMVRIMAREQRMELAILLDCGRTSQLQAGQLSQLHHNVNVVARLTELAVSQGDHVACITYADRPLSLMPLTSGIAGLKHARALLKSARSVPQESNLLAAALRARRLLGHRALVVILTDMSAGDDASQFAQAVRLLGAKHLTVIASIEDTDVQGLQWLTPSHWLDPYRSFAAQEYLRERELMKMRLKQHGASIITAPPDMLDSKLLDYYRQLRQRVAV
jgi:uncharacterized protein (DUF58 family)